MSNPKVQVADNSLFIRDVECQLPDVVTFFREVPESERTDLICRALGVGVTGLRAAGVTNHIQTVKHEFERMGTTFAAMLEEIESRLVDRVQMTFDPDRADSVSRHIGDAVKDAHDGAVTRMESARVELQEIIKDSFNPDLGTSAVARLFKLVSDTRSDLDRQFDPSYKDSYIGRLTATVDEYFGDDGSIADLVGKQLVPIKEAFEHQIQELRDLIPAQNASAAARRKSSLSGGDFEAEVEELLRHVAKSYGDSVERVGYLAGDDGASKKGDFVVEMSEGVRFVVEAKDYSNPISLRGNNGILKTLDAAMMNRSAGFAICVMKEDMGFPNEVGSFNDYDDDKILCVFGSSGELLEAAYRWARSSLLSQQAAESGLDVEIVSEAIADARSALRELKTIEAKAKAITRNAEDIRSLVSFQLRRANAALDEAEKGLCESDVFAQPA